IPKFPQGKALDMNQAGSVLGFEPNITGANDYDETEGSEVVVITAGKPRSPGMSRDDLVTTNEAIVGSVTREVVKRSRDAIIVVVSNHLDAMCHVAKAHSRWKKHRVFGMAGILDTARFSAFIAWETGCSVKDVTATVLGGHGDQMVPVVSATTVGGIPLRKLVDDAEIEQAVVSAADHLSFWHYPTREHNDGRCPVGRCTATPAGEEQREQRERERDCENTPSHHLHEPIVGPAPKERKKSSSRRRRDR